MSRWPSSRLLPDSCTSRRGRSSTCSNITGSAPMSEPVVRTRNLTKRFDGPAVLDDVSVIAEAGDVIGVLGKNGAGKTTLIEVLLGFSPPSDGTAEIFGHES